jgi:hypothetical protein
MAFAVRFDGVAVDHADVAGFHRVGVRDRSHEQWAGQDDVSRE